MKRSLPLSFSTSILALQKVATIIIKYILSSHSLEDTWAARSLISRIYGGVGLFLQRLRPNLSPETAGAADHI